jgi:peroxiredoxin
MDSKLGALFPIDVPVVSRTGTVRIADLITHGPLVLAFHRSWCPFCQQAARDLAGAGDRFREYGARIAIVYREDIDTVTRSCAERSLGVECLSDPRRELEAAAEIERFSIRRYGAFSPARLIAALRSGSRIGAVKADVLQGRGTFVIDTDGRVVYEHRAVTAADIPDIDDVVAAVRSVRSSAR